MGETMTIRYFTPYVRRHKRRDPAMDILGRYLHQERRARPPALGERITHGGRTYEIYDWERRSFTDDGAWRGVLYAWCKRLKDPKSKEN